ncbi:MAG: IS1 family transposase [Planctomycetes bacterium]|nr:IS1 family transposase [Planctomycetota bacterium]
MIYEKIRNSNLDRRFKMDKDLVSNIQAHGVAGLFINPENSLCSLSSSKHRTSPRKHTAFYHTHLADEVFETIARSLAEGISVAATARIQNVDKKTVLLVLAKAGLQAKRVSHSLLMDISVSECQLDEMWSFVGKKEKNLDPIEKLQCVLGDSWIWIAFDAVNKIVLAYVIGKRTLPHAISLLEEVKRISNGMPDLFSSDQLNQYTNALLQVYGQLVYPERKPGPGRPPNPRLVPPEDLLYVQVVKQYKQYRVVKVSRKVVFGNSEKVERILESSSVSSKINTSFVERNNGTIRHMNARCVRKTYCFSKCQENHEHQLALSLAYYHLCRPHKSLTKRFGRPTTPFMAANLTNHVWTMGELLCFNTKIHDK